jgi:hypothetical protein
VIRRTLVDMPYAPEHLVELDRTKPLSELIEIPEPEEQKQPGEPPGLAPVDVQKEFWARHKDRRPTANKLHELEQRMQDASRHWGMTRELRNRILLAHAATPGHPCARGPLIATNGPDVARRHAVERSRE